MMQKELGDSFRHPLLIFSCLDRHDELPPPKLQLITQMHHVLLDSQGWGQVLGALSESRVMPSSGCIHYEMVQAWGTRFWYFCLTYVLVNSQEGAKEMCELHHSDIFGLRFFFFLIFMKIDL